MGIGVGLIALQLTWLVANRIASLVWDPPVGPTVDSSTAVVVAVVASVIAGRRLLKSVQSPQP